MLKKLFIVFTMGMLLLVVVACGTYEIDDSNNQSVIKDDSNIIDDREDKITDTLPTLQSVTFNNDSISLIYDDNQEVIEYQNAYDSNITINGIILEEEQLIIFGSRNNKPYLSLPTFTEVGKIELTNSNEFMYHRDGEITRVRYEPITNIYEADFTLNDNFSSTFIIEANRDYLTTVKEEIQFNYTKGQSINPNAIVIHETANYNTGADAYSHYKFWNSPNRGSSAHFGVDENIVFQYLDITKFAWQVGNYNKALGVSNANSIGIEIMVNKDGNYYKAIHNTIKLTAKLMVQLNIGIENVVTHQMASAWGKPDPLSMLVYSVNDTELKSIRTLLGGNAYADQLILNALENNPKAYTISDFYNDLEEEYHRLVSNNNHR